MGEEEEEERNQVESANDRKAGLKAGDTSRKFIRVITVVIYLFSVSMAAIMLSLYYLFFWNPPVQTRLERLVDPIQLHFSQIYMNVTKKDDLDLMNDTYENAEREEPRVLPVKGFEALWSKQEMSENDQSHYNYSVGSENENKTILHKLLNLLKAE